MNLEALWSSKEEAEWEAADRHYDSFVKSENVNLEEELEAKMCQIVSLEDIRVLHLSENWYDLLLNKYFKWKYTSANRYATTSKSFCDAYETNKPLLDRLIVSILSEPDKLDTELMGFKTNRIHGLGIAGASGLLSLLYPKLYGTIDQFVVNNLKQILSLPENGKIRKMNPMNLGLKDLTVLTEIYRRKSRELNEQFQSDRWTPRRIDRVLWGLRPVGTIERRNSRESGI